MSSEGTSPPSITLVFRRAVDLLFVLNPRGTSIGAFAGVALKAFTLALSPMFARYQTFVDPDRVNVLYWMAIGVFVVNLPRVFGERDLPPEIEDAFAMLKRLHGTIPEAHIKLRYLALADQVLQQARSSQKGPEAAA